MDLLQEYSKGMQPSQNAPRVQSPNTEPRYIEETGFLIRLVIQASGGKIQNTRQASFVLFGITLFIFISAIIIFLLSSGSLWTVPVPPPSQT
ncbi:MAG: hypothetical protein HY617_00385 [Candidatus Sungbacteria bacterium]|nr:hypothetical protein [Candidatus Sungbacteria bacterium]